MSVFTIDGSLLTNIAAAIRTKKGTSDSYTPTQMAAAINGMGVGATKIKVLDAVYSANEKMVPRQAAISITLSQKIDSISSIECKTYNEKALGGFSLADDGRHINVFGADYEPAYLNVLKVYGYTHNIQ